MIDPLILPPRWFVRPLLIAAAAAVAVLLGAAQQSIRVADAAAPRTLLAQPIGPGRLLPDRAARLMQAVAAWPELSSVRVLTPAEVRGWLGEAGIAVPPGLSPPPLVEIAVRRPRDLDAVAARVAAIPGTGVTNPPDRPAVTRWPVRLLAPLAAVLLLAGFVDREARATAAALGLLHDLGGTRGQVRLHRAVAIGGSLATGSLGGALLAWLVGAAPALPLLLLVAATAGVIGLAAASWRGRAADRR